MAPAQLTIHRASPEGAVDLNRRPRAAASRKPSAVRPTRLGLLRAAGVAVLCVVLSSCFVLEQNETFAIGTETNRLNLVIFVDWTGILDEYRVQNGTTKTRNLVLDQTPQSISLSAGQKALACTLSAAACAAGIYLPGVILSWFKDDVRNRGDFGGDLAAARLQADCFAWTALPARNFTTKPPGNPGCT